MSSRSRSIRRHKNAIENKQVEVARQVPPPSGPQAQAQVGFFAQAAHKMPMPRKHLPLSGESV